MPKDVSSSVSRRTGLVVLQELLQGFQRLILTSNVQLGERCGIGGFADVYSGTILCKETNAQKQVAVKKLRFMVEKERDFAKVRLDST